MKKERKKTRKIFVILALPALALALWSIWSEDKPQPIKQAKTQAPFHTLQEGPLPALAWKILKDAGHRCETIVRVTDIGNETLGPKLYKVKAVKGGVITVFVINAQQKPNEVMTWDQFSIYRDRAYKPKEQQKAKVEQEEFDRFLKRQMFYKIKDAGYKYKESQISRAYLSAQQPRLYCVTIELSDRSKGKDILGVLILTNKTIVLPWIEAHQMWQSLRHQ